MQVRAGSSPVIRTKQHKSEPYANRRRVRICCFSEWFLIEKTRIALRLSSFALDYSVCSAFHFSKITLPSSLSQKLIMSGSKVLTNASITSSDMPEIISDGLFVSATENKFCSPFFLEGDKSINERLFTQLYSKLFSIICQTFLNGCKSLIFCNLKFRP